MKFVAVALSVVFVAPTAQAQFAPKPGPEHEILKKLEGTWDLTMKFGADEAKGTVTYKMELNGMWLVGTTETQLFGEKFCGKSLDTYDPAKKKYVGVWADSMGPMPMILEGTFDKETKTKTMLGDGPGMDGKLTKYKSVSVFTDDNTINFSMYIGDVKEPSFTIVYKRKK